MVGKKKNFITCLLCLLFAVILPFSFVACKNNTTSDGDNDNPTQEATKNDNNDENGDNDSGGGNEGNTEPAYAFNIEEISEILDGSEEKLDDFIVRLNNSNLLKENNLDDGSAFISNTKEVIKHAYYPSYLIDVFDVHCSNANTEFEQDTVYQFTKDGGSDYIEFYTIGEDRLIIDLLSHEVNGSVNQISYYCYDFTIVNNEISKMVVSNYFTNLSAKKVTFENATFDFAKHEFTMEFGKINNHNDSAETFFNKKFNKDNFLSIPAGSWTYTNFGQFKFGEVKSFEIKEGDDARKEIVNQFDTLGFLGVFEKFNEYQNLDVEFKFGLVDDFRGYIEDGNLISVTYNNYAFKTNGIN